MNNRKQILLTMQQNDQLVVEALDLSSILSTLTNAVANVIDKNDIAGSILQIIADGVIVMYGGIWWGLASAILNYGFGINIKTVWAALKRIFSSFFKSGKADTVTPGTLDSTSENLANQTMSLISLPDDKASKPISELIEENPEIATSACRNENGEIIKTAFGLGTILGWIGKLTTKGFFGDLLKNTIKALLAGAGIGVATATGVSVIKQNLPAATNTGLPPSVSVPPTITPPIGQYKQPAINIQKYIGNPSGKGEKTYANDADKDGSGTRMWILPNNVGSFEEFMFSWFENIYPDCPENLARTIESNFAKATSQIKRALEEFNINKNIDDAGSYIRVPNNFTSIKQIIDSILSVFVAK